MRGCRISELINKLKELNEDEVEYWLDVLPEDGQVELQEHFKTNPGDWIDLCCYAYDPESSLGDHYRKFRLFEAQKEYVNDLYALIDPKIKPSIYPREKSRRIGWTNTALCYLTWAAIYRNASSIIAAQDQDTTDTLGNEQTALMERIRTIIKKLPSWMQEQIEYKSQHLNISINNATIKGLASGSKQSGAKAGRAGRVQYALLDECGFWDSMTLEMAFNALAPTAKVRLCISSAAETNTHFFSRLVDGEITQSKSAFIPHTVNPANTEEWYEGLKQTMSPAKFLQELHGKRGGSDAKIMRGTQRESFYVPEDLRHNGERYWTIDHPQIQDWLKFEGSLVIGWDGGGQANFSAAVVAWRSKEKDRWIVFEEFANAPPGGELEQVVEQVQFYLMENWAQVKMEDYGDPVMAGKSDVFRVESGGRELNILDHLRQPSLHLTKEVQTAYKSAWQGRMGKRIAHTDWLLNRRLSDGFPKVIFCKPCENLRKGFLDGGYQWEVKYGEVVRNEIHQNHPLADICDAFTYPILAIYPILPSELGLKGRGGKILR